MSTGSRKKLRTAAENKIGAVVARTQDIMRQFGEIALDGFSLRTDSRTAHHPKQYPWAVGV